MCFCCLNELIYVLFNFSSVQVLNGGVQADERQDVAAAENQEDSELASQSQESVQPPPRPQQFQQPQRPLQRPPPRRPGPQRFPQGPPRRRPTRRPGRRTTTSKGILGSAVDAVNAAVGGVGERLSCTGTNILTEAKLRDEAFIKFQLDCAMNVGPCDEIGEKIKSKLPSQVIEETSPLFVFSLGARGVGREMSTAVQRVHKNPNQTSDGGTLTEIPTQVPRDDASTCSTERLTNQANQFSKQIHLQTLCEDFFKTFAFPGSSLQVSYKSTVCDSHVTFIFAMSVDSEKIEVFSSHFPMAGAFS